MLDQCRKRWTTYLMAILCFLSVREPVDTAHPEFDLDDATREYEPETLLGSIRRYLQDHAYSESIQTSEIVQTFQASAPG